MAQDNKPPTSLTTPPETTSPELATQPPTEVTSETKLAEATEYIKELEQKEKDQKEEIAKLKETVKSLKAEAKEAKEPGEFDLLGWIEAKVDAEELQQQSISEKEPLPEWISLEAEEDRAMFIRKVDLTTATGFAPDTFENQGKQIGEFAKTKFAEGLTVKHQFRAEGKVAASERPATIITIMLVKGY